MQPLIFISNDDGIHSPGLKAAAESVHMLGELIVAAPSNQQSAMGGSLCGDRSDCFHPLEYEAGGKRIPAFHTDYSPAQVLIHGLEVLCPQRKPDLVISGFNYGENLGASVLASGTVGVALRAASKGIPAIAVSMEVEQQYHFEYGAIDWSAAIHFAHFFAGAVLSQKMPFDVDVLKIDVPLTATSETPWKITRVSRTNHFSSFIESPTLDTARDAAQVRVCDPENTEKDSDIYALMVERVVSVTPLSLNMTSRVDSQVLHETLSS
ncbi:MAG: 5'/3'-nucleotidase SurE [SAR324 cluster bacterium]|nr:5'/3'-nucleotidase SurE [SAR324 cluster bacterium]